MVEYVLAFEVSPLVKDFFAGFFFQGKPLLGIFLIAGVGKDLDDATFVKVMLKQIYI